ncbi:MAG: 16S rRNA (adenine(1518)-N(6)/adenine(1519)-N(6))-dimethyltransferase RsmA [Lautropia sp.]
MSSTGSSNPDRDGGHGRSFRVLPRKRFGQHFLIDRGVIGAIVDAVAPAAGEPVIEIGPGTGALTAPLLARAGALTAIEIDRDLAPRLAARFGPALRIVEQDVLTVDFAALAAEQGGAAPRLVGNLPYNISSPLLIRLCGFADRIRDQHFMLQRELVDRIVAGPGPDLGRLTVMLQNRFDVDRLFDVPPAAFDPPPRVASSVIRMVPKPAPLTTRVALLEQLLAAAFGQRRKMLRNTLGRWLEKHAPAISLAGLAAGDPALAEFADPTRRPEMVAVASWCALAERLGGHGPAAVHPPGFDATMTSGNTR